jgi:hypothetical protein
VLTLALRAGQEVVMRVPADLFRFVRDHPNDETAWASACSALRAAEPAIEGWLRAQGFPSGVAQAGASITTDKLVDLLCGGRAGHVENWDGYVRAVARRAATTVLRRRARFVNVDPEAVDVPRPSVQRARYEALLSDLGDAVANLPEADRQLLLLRVVEERTQAEIAAQYRTYQGAVCRRLQALMGQLRRQMLPAMRREGPEHPFA